MAVKPEFTKLTDNFCIEGNSNRGFYFSRNSDHKVIFVKICGWSSESS